jgi:hypothetical protein
MSHYFFMLFLMISPFCFGVIQELWSFGIPNFASEIAQKSLKRPLWMFKMQVKALFAWKEGKKGAHIVPVRPDKKIWYVESYGKVNG